MRCFSYPLAVVIAMFTLGCATSVKAVNVPLEQMGVPERMFNAWGPLPDSVKAELRRLLDAPQELEDLLSSTDPREVGLGLFVLEQNQDLERLISLVDLLDDPRQTIPYAAPTSRDDHYIPMAQTVGEYLAHIYAMWLGVSPEKALDRKEEIRNIDDPWARPRSWLKRLQRAERPEMLASDTPQQREQRVADVKAEIAALPSQIRWAIIADRYGTGVYSHAEARDALLALDPVVRDQIMTGNPLAIHVNEVGWNLHDKDLVIKARELLSGP